MFLISFSLVVPFLLPNILRTGSWEILHLLVDMFPIKMPQGVSYLPCPIKLPFHVSVSKGLWKETPMPDVHSLLGVVQPNGVGVI
jgi:hypothetical protein